ncbi:alpha/beta hydrolase [Frankia gtarii]|uniref:alpha/beta hydrolase n=1 Tax=Frankia gtarii TaxID=2950102 RepID=UPI0022286B55
MSIPLSPLPSHPRPRGYVGGPGSRYWPSGDTTRRAGATVVLLPGRGESAEIFENLAFRLALDGYQVTFLDHGQDTVLALGEAREPDLPFVLLGSDSGALRALVGAASPAVRPDALILVDLPLLHRPVAGEHPGEPIPRSLPDLPILLLHGEDDPVTPFPLVRMATRTARRARLAALPGGRGVLSGSGRRAAGAHILLFLEGLRTPRLASAARSA